MSTPAVHVWFQQLFQTNWALHSQLSCLATGTQIVLEQHALQSDWQSFLRVVLVCQEWRLFNSIPSGSKAFSSARICFLHSFCAAKSFHFFLFMSCPFVLHFVIGQSQKCDWLLWSSVCVWRGNRWKRLLSVCLHHYLPLSAFALQPLIRRLKQNDPPSCMYCMLCSSGMSSSP